MYTIPSMYRCILDVRIWERYSNMEQRSMTASTMIILLGSHAYQPYHEILKLIMVMSPKLALSVYHMICSFCCQVQMYYKHKHFNTLCYLLSECLYIFITCFNCICFIFAPGPVYCTYLFARSRTWDGTNTIGEIISYYKY